MQASFNIYSSLTAATSVRQPDFTTITATRKANTQKDIARRELFINVPLSLITVPTLPDAFRPLVEAILLRTLQDQLNSWRDTNQLATTIPASAPFLTQSSLATIATEGTRSAWLSQEELTQLFDTSATWKRLQSSERYKNEQTYRQLASAFRDMIIRLAAKNLSLSEREQDQILAKIEPSDMSTPLGEFVAMRIDKMRNKQSTLSLDDL